MRAQPYIKHCLIFIGLLVSMRESYYRMVYLNMGHGDEGFINATQNLLFTNAFRLVAFPNEE